MTDNLQYPSSEMDMLIERWRAAWPKALAAWSRYTRLHDARLCGTTVQAANEGLAGSFAMIRLVDQSVVIDLAAVTELGLQDYGVEILAHEIGHHVLAPGSATDHYRLLARIRRALPTLENAAPMIANLYTDLCINDRLQRQCGLRMADIYRTLARDTVPPSGPPEVQQKPGAVWTLYMRIYEHLWKLDKGSLVGAEPSDAIDTDAWLGAQVIRVYATEWMAGAGRFATLVLPYLVEDAGGTDALRHLHDTKEAAVGCMPGGLLDVELDELDGAVHPVNDPRITGLDDDSAAQAERSAGSASGQAREPFEYGEILKAAGIKLTDHQIAMRYYRERALAHLIPFPSRQAEQAGEPQLEAVEPWEIGDPLDDIDWLQSLTFSPRPVPGVTTVRRVYSPEPGNDRDRTPIDLDMYVDSSGSMPNPQTATSYLALAGAIIALSALRAGSSVQVTLWSGKSQVLGTAGFVRDSDDVLRVLTGFFGGATCFPIHRLRKTYAGQGPRRRPVHILMISDDGITTMFDRDEKGNNGWDISAAALAAAGAGGTMALNLPAQWESMKTWSDWMKDLKRARAEQGWEIHAVTDMEQLVAFARAFSRRHYAGDQPGERK